MREWSPVGFWDFIAPDYDSFNAVFTDLLPERVGVGPYSFERSELIPLGYAAPGSAIGLTMRTYYEIQKTIGGSRSQADAVNSAVNNQGTAEGPNGEWKVGSAVAPIVIPSVYRVAINAVAGGRQVINVVGVRGSTSGQEAAAAAAVRAAWKVTGGPMTQLSNLYALTSFEATDLSTLNGGIAVVTDTTAGGISSSPAFATRGAAALIKWNGGTRSRSTRGRLYYGPLRETSINTDGATVATADVTAFTSAFTAMLNSLTTAGFPLVVISRLNQSATNVTTFAVESTIATQRRRIRS